MEVNFWKGHLRIGHQQIGWSRGLSILGTAQGFKTMLHRKRTDFKTLLEFWDNQISVYVRRYLFVAQPWRAFPASNGFVFFFVFKAPNLAILQVLFLFLPEAALSLIWSTGFHWIQLGPWRFRSYNHLAKWPEPYIRIQSHQNLPVFNGGALEGLWGWPHATGIWYLIGGLGNHWQGWKNCGRQTIWHWRLANGLVFDLYESVLSFEVHSLYFHVSRQLAQRQCSKHWRLGYPKFVSSQL